jgi:hypothetical protein
MDEGIESQREADVVFWVVGVKESSRGSRSWGGSARSKRGDLEGNAG